MNEQHRMSAEVVLGRPAGCAPGRGLLAALFVLLVFVLPAQAITVQSVRSDGGIEAWLVEDRSVPVVSLEVAFLGGASTDPKEKGGLANMVAGLLDEGAGDLDNQAFQRSLENLASSVRFSANQDNFTGTARSLSKNLPATLDFMALALAKPRFDPQPVERVRSEIIVSLARKSETPNSIANRLWWRNAFPDHPYGRPSEGTPESVPRITVEDLRRFVAERIARDVMTIGVVGDIDAATLKPLLDRTFEALPASAASAIVPDTTVKSGGATLLVRKPIPQSVITFGQQGLKRDDPDWYTAYVMNYVLGGGGFTSRLTTEIREKRGLAYGVYSYLSPLRHAGVYLGGVATENSRAPESMELVRAEWKRMREAGPSEEELQNAKTYLTGSFPLQFDSTGRIAGTLISVQQDRLGIDYFDKRNALIEAVTIGDVRRVAQRLLDPDALSFVVVGSPSALAGAREVGPDGS